MGSRGRTAREALKDKIRNALLEIGHVENTPMTPEEVQQVLTRLRNDGIHLPQEGIDELMAELAALPEAMEQEDRAPPLSSLSPLRADARQDADPPLLSAPTPARTHRRSRPPFLGAPTPARTPAPPRTSSRSRRSPSSLGACQARRHSRSA